MDTEWTARDASKSGAVYVVFLCIVLALGLLPRAWHAWMEAAWGDVCTRAVIETPPGGVFRECQCQEWSRWWSAPPWRTARVASRCISRLQGPRPTNRLRLQPCTFSNLLCPSQVSSLPVFCFCGFLFGSSVFHPFQSKGHLSMYRDPHYVGGFLLHRGNGIPMIKIRRSWDRLIFMMGIPLLTGIPIIKIRHSGDLLSLWESLYW